jgi:hypothetical protein
MISVAATLVFFVLIFHAFYKSTPADNNVDYNGRTVILLPRKLLIARGIDPAKIESLDSTERFKHKSILPFLSLISNDLLLGLPLPAQVGFQKPATSIIEGLVDLHHDIMFFLVFIIVFVLYLLIIIVLEFGAPNNKPRNTSTVVHHTRLEVI